MSQAPELLRRLLRARDRMDAAPQKAWTVRQLAEVSAVTEAHFAREFRKAFGLRPHRYLLTRRVERAIALLRDTRLPVTQVALETGWSSVGTFTRVFRDITDETPGALRARLRTAAHTRQDVPECIVRAAHRPDLNTAVSEKRRGKATARMGALSKEVP